MNRARRQRRGFVRSIKVIGSNRCLTCNRFTVLIWGWVRKWTPIGRRMVPVAHIERVDWPQITFPTAQCTA